MSDVGSSEKFNEFIRSSFNYISEGIDTRSSEIRGEDSRFLEYAREMVNFAFGSYDSHFVGMPGFIDITKWIVY